MGPHRDVLGCIRFFFFFFFFFFSFSGMGYFAEQAKRKVEKGQLWPFQRASVWCTCCSGAGTVE